MNDEVSRPEDVYYKGIILRQALYRYFRRIGKSGAFWHDAGAKMAEANLNQRLNMITIVAFHRVRGQGTGRPYCRRLRPHRARGQDVQRPGS